MAFLGDPICKGEGVLGVWTPGDHVLCTYLYSLCSSRSVWNIRSEHPASTNTQNGNLCGLCYNTEQHPVLWRWTRQLCLWSSWRWRAWAIIQLSTQSVHRMMKSSPVFMYSMQQIAVEDPGKNLLHNCRVCCYNEEKRDCTSHNSSSVLNADVTYRITRSKKLLSPKLWKKKNKTYIFQVCDINMQW